MRLLFWLAAAAFPVALVWIAWYIRRKAAERKLAEEARAAAFLTDFAAARRPVGGTAAGAAAPVAAPTPPEPLPAAPANDVALQKLLFESAHKAAEAGEPALAIQLYARLLARFPATHFAETARAAVSALNRKAPKG